MIRPVHYDPDSLGRINALFDTYADSRLAAAVEAVTEGLEQGLDEFRALAADGEEFHVPDEVEFQPLRAAAGGLVTLHVAEATGEEQLPVWAIVYQFAKDGASVQVRYAGPRSQYDA